MHFRSILVAALSIVALGFATRAGHAQVAPERTTDNGRLARAQLDIAERAYNEKRYRDAVTAYLAADRLEPTAAIQLALGKTYEQLNDPSRALASYREYFNRSPRAPDRAHVQARVSALAQQLAERGVQQVCVTSIPSGASVIVDKKSFGVTPLYIDLPPGKHHLEFHQKGYSPAALDFELSPQQPLNVMTTLVPARADAATAQATSTPPPGEPEPVPPAEAPAVAEVGPEAGPADTGVQLDRPPSSHANLLRTLGFAAIGTSIAALGGAVTFELMRSHSESRARQQDQQIAFARTLDTMDSQQTAARVFAVTAGVLAVAGGVLLVMAIEPEEHPEASGVTAACSPTSCHATLRGNF